MHLATLRKRTRGFTLLEMAVVLVIVGVMTGLLTQTQNAVQPSGCYVSTKQQLATIREAMDLFVRNNNRLPLPAGRSLGVKNTMYGREAPAPTDTSIDRLANNGGTIPKDLLFGALPFQALNLPESYASDCWGNKFSYVVTQAMTTSSVSGGYPDPTIKGGVTIKVSATVTIADATTGNGMNYAVISHGENGAKVGGVARNYTTAAHGWCAVGTALDTENCDITGASGVIIMDAMFNNGANAGANFFDDVVIYGGRYLSTLGNTFCWGGNTYGELGNGTTGINSSVPVAVTMPAGVNYFTKIERGNGFMMCGYGDDDNLYCWGDGTTLGRANFSIPTLVAPPGGKLIVAAMPGQDFFNMLADDDTVYWWQWGGWNATWAVNAHHSSVTRYNICAIDNSGDEWCWGDGWAGQNGDGGTSNHPPQKVTMPVGRTFTRTAGGYANYCSIADNGESYCWGSNDHGEGGNGGACAAQCLTPYLTSRPGAVSRWLAVDTGYASSCWIGNDLKTYCAGDNSTCNLGIGNCTGTWHNTPTAQVTLAGGVYFTQLSMGSNFHHCALGSDGIPYCWGDGTKGGLGNGTSPAGTGTPTPVIMPAGISKFTQLGTSTNTTCGVTAPQNATNELVCWGHNWTHQLGDGTTTPHEHPHRVTKPGGVTGWRDVAGSGYDTCGLATNGNVYCWGSGGSTNGVNTGTPTLMNMPGSVTISSIYAGGDAFCALDSGGNAYCWYYSGAKPATSSTPAAVTMPGAVKFTTMSIGYNPPASSGYDTTICAIGTDGNGYCWGKNTHGFGGVNGLVGDGTAVNRANPVMVTMPGGGVTFTKISVGTYLACALGSNGREYCWGANPYSQFADSYGPNRNVPTLVALPGTATAITDIAVGEYIHCVTANDNKNYCAGRQDEGQAANGVNSSSALTTWTAMQRLPLNSAFTKLYYGSMTSAHHACGVTSLGKLYCWGSNDYGQIGDNSNVMATYPVEVENLGYASTVPHVAVMDQHTCAVVQ